MNLSDFDTEFTPLIDQLARIQAACGWSDRRITTRYRALGSPKTWRQRLLAHDFQGINLDKMSRKLRALQAELSGGTPVEEYYQLPFSARMDTLLCRLEGQVTDRRILCCLAMTGVGKSVWARHAVDEDRAGRVYLRCRPTWREKKVHLCSALARALGDAPATTGEADAEDKVISQLKSLPRTVIIDEAHEGGIALMKLLRTFVDETSARFVYLAYPTEYERVTSATKGSLIEAQQFLGRCVKPIYDRYAEGIHQEDLTDYLKAAEVPDPAAIARELLPLVRKSYNLRIVADAIEECRMASDTDFTARDVVKAMAALCRITAPANPED